MIYLENKTKVIVEPVLDHSFIKTVQSELNKEPVKIKVQLDTGSIKQLQNDFPALKLKLDNNQITKDVKAVTKDTSAAYKTLSDNISQLSNIAGFNQIAKVGLQGLKLIVDNQEIAGASKEINGLGIEYQRLTSHADEFNKTLSKVGTSPQDMNLTNSFLDIGTAILKVVDNIGLLNTAMVGLSLFGTKKGVG